MQKNKTFAKLFVGILISALFLYLSFNKIEFAQMKAAFKEANYIFIIPAIFAIFLSHWIRSIRWYYLLKPIKKIAIPKLFSALLIGYMGNTILPAHLGEFIRGYILGKNQKISKSAVMATIVIERLIDMISLLFLMAIVLILNPFPDWVHQKGDIALIKKGGYIMFFFTLVLLVILMGLKSNKKIQGIVKNIIGILPAGIAGRLASLVDSFVQGIMGLENKKDYLIIALHSLLIWMCYGLVLYILFYAFNFTQIYQLGVITALVLLVITTIGIVVPSSPGYVGTYHLLCQFSLDMFGVPRSIGLTYAIVAHAVNILPVLIVGLILFWNEGLKLLKLSEIKD